MAASTIEEGRNPYPPWPHLPTELIHDIAQKLADDISDFIRFRGVCRPWRQAAKPSDLRPQPPWLLLPYDPKSSSRSFFSLADQSTRTILLPETRNQSICGSSDGWLIMLDQTLTVSLFHPFTRSLLRLPPITFFPGDRYGLRVEETYNGDARVVTGGGGEVTLEKMTDWFDCFACISTDPESVNAVDGVVAFTTTYSSRIQYCKLGDAGWTVADPGLGNDIKAMAFHKGNFYFLDSTVRTAVCELGPVKKEPLLIPSVNLDGHPPYRPLCHYLVTFRDDLLLVTCHKKYNNSNYFVLDGMRFVYHKLEVGSGGTMTWSRIGGAGDCTLFLTDGRFHATGRLMTVASSAPGCRKGLVYYVVPPIYRGRGLSRMKVIMLDGCDIRQYHGPWTKGKPNPMSSSWIVPSLC